MNARDLQPDREPSADMRQLAASLREMYLALVREGFMPPEALAIVGYAVSAAAGGKA